MIHEVSLLAGWPVAFDDVLVAHRNLWLSGPSPAGAGSGLAALGKGPRRYPARTDSDSRSCCRQLDTQCSNDGLTLPLSLMNDAFV